MMDASLHLAKIMKLVIKTADNCWIWQGVLKDGYATIFQDGRYQGVHRWLYIQIHGKASVMKKHLHHKCSNRDCINPEHIQPLTPKQHYAMHYKSGNPNAFWK